MRPDREAQAGGSHAEADDVGQRVQLAAHHRGLVPPACDAPVHHVEEQGEHDEDPGRVDLADGARAHVVHGEEDGGGAARAVGEGQEIREMEVADHREVPLARGGVGAHDVLPSRLTWGARPLVTMDAIYRSDLNRDVPPARAGEFAAVRIGPLRVWPPVVLAPMAGVTNPPFRTLCRRFGAGLYVSEMITARALVEGNRKTVLLASFGPEETTRSLQLYGVDPHYVGEAVRLLVGEGRVDHIDMNFGCPVRKVTSKGGGAAIPLKPRLLRAIVRAAVRRRGSGARHHQVPHGHRRRPPHLPRRRAHRARRRAAPRSALHARTAAQLYDGEARLGRDRASSSARSPRIPVLGNGDIWEAEDALRMMRTHRLRRRDRRPRLPGPALALPRPGRRVRRPRARRTRRTSAAWWT